MSTSAGVETLAESRARGFTWAIQSRCFLWSSMEYTLWKGNGEKSDVPTTASRIAATSGVFLSPSRWPPKPGLGALGILELDDPRTLDGFFADAEKPGGHLGNHVIGVRDEALGISALAGATEGIPVLATRTLPSKHTDVGRTERHAAAVPGDVDLHLGRRVVAAVQEQFRRDIFPPKSLRGRLRGTGTGACRIRRPKPLSRTRDERGGRWPVSAMAHVLASRSGVQRQSPRVSNTGFSESDSAPPGHAAMQ